MKIIIFATPFENRLEVEHEDLVGQSLGISFAKAQKESGWPNVRVVDLAKALGKLLLGPQ